MLDHLKQALRAALLERGATVAVTDGYQPYDLQVRTADGVAAALNLLNAHDGRIVVGWSLGLRPIFAARRLIALSVAAALALVLGGGLNAAIAIGVLGALALVALFILDARRIAPLVELAVRDVGAVLAEDPQMTQRGAA
jgi:hypothetical protein